MQTSTLFQDGVRLPVRDRHINTGELGTRLLRLVKCMRYALRKTHRTRLMEGSQYLDSQQSRICISLPPIESSMGSRSYMENKEICYLESSLGDSPSSLSSTSLEDAPPAHTERDQVRSSGRNQLGRTYSPGLPLSMCEREEIVKLFQVGLLQHF
ncbi:hypothetical protein OESDEN_05578, partial [Oesophagostomum dentatum]